METSCLIVHNFLVILLPCQRISKFALGTIDAILLQVLLHPKRLHLRIIGFKPVQILLTTKIFMLWLPLKNVFLGKVKSFTLIELERLFDDTNFRHWAQVMAPQSGQISLLCLGRAKNPEGHWVHHLKLGSLLRVRSRNLRWNSSWMSLSSRFLRKISKLEKYSKCSSLASTPSGCWVPSALKTIRLGNLQKGQLQSLMLCSVI